MFFTKIMIKQLLNTLRSFRKKPILLFVSIPGLAIGLTAFLLLMIYVKHETSYDTHFSTKDRLVRLYTTFIIDETVDNTPRCLRKAYTEIPYLVPEIELATQVYNGGYFKIKADDKQISSQAGLYADAEFLKVFGLDLMFGNVDDALKSPLSAVLSETLAIKLFNTTECLGKILITEDQEYNITGIIKDLPVNTHFSFDLLLSISTIRPERFGGLEFFTYYLLNEGADPESSGKKIAEEYDKILDDGFNLQEQRSISGTEMLSDLHLFTKADFDLTSKGNITNLYILSFLAAFILLIAVVNTVNLFVLYGEKRSKEIGVRKSLGAGLVNLRKLFYFETSIICISAFILAFITTIAVIPLFAQVADLRISIDDILDFQGITGMIVFMIVLIIICGAYPSVYLSRLGTINAIKGGRETIKRKKWLSIISVITQFSISVFLIVSLLVIVSQVKYLKDIPLGFNPENVIMITRFDNAIRNKSATVMDELKKLPFVKSTASSTHWMGGGCSGQGIYVHGESEENEKYINEYRVHGGFCKLLELPLSSGRYFSGTGDDQQSVILNQSAVNMLGMKDPVEKTVYLNGEPYKVIGVVEDFYYNRHSGEEIEPLVIAAYSDWLNIIYLRIDGEFGINERKQVSDLLLQFDADYIPHFVDLKYSYKRKFWKEDQLIDLLLYGTLLAIFLSFTGMFALSVFNVEKRTKEIGIRKVMGSSSNEVMLFLLVNMLKWVLWAMVPAFLVAYIILKEWLMEFAERINLGIMYFLVAGVLALVVAIVAISVQSYFAARRNPVDSLRYE